IIPGPACLGPRPARCRWLAHPQENLTTTARHLRRIRVGVWGAHAHWSTLR
ncbi:hypothetical protein C8R44DRAFT_768711, partial [Mycena epipterygia]